MTTTRLLIIGGSDAGISAALRARECDPACDVTVVLADQFPNYSICGLPFYLSGEVPDWHATLSPDGGRPRLLGHPPAARLHGPGY